MRQAVHARVRGDSLGHAEGEFVIHHRGQRQRAQAGDFAPVVTAGRDLVARGVEAVLVTLGGSGACLVTKDGAWAATPPPTEVRSTVGAGDSSLAGYLIARLDDASAAECLRRAVAYGSAAASMPGTGLPSPEDLNLEQTEIFPV